MRQLLREGTASNLLAIVGLSFGSEKYAEVACCPSTSLSFGISKEATNGHGMVGIQGVIPEQNEGGSFILPVGEKTNFSPQEDQGIRDMKMKTLKEKFKEKLERAKKLRETTGDPIALARSIIEIPEDKADQSLDEVRGFKYVSKKA